MRLFIKDDWTFLVGLCLCFITSCQSANTATKASVLRQNDYQSSQRHQPNRQSHLIDDESSVALAKKLPKLQIMKESNASATYNEAQSTARPNEETALAKEAKRFYELVNVAGANPQKRLQLLSFASKKPVTKLCLR